MNKTQLTEMAFQIVSFAGDARGIATEGIQLAKKGEISQAREKIKEAKDTISQAHHIQFDMVSAEANGEELPFSVLLIHGQDHLMTAMAVIDMAKEFIDLYDKLNN